MRPEHIGDAFQTLKSLKHTNVAEFTESLYLPPTVANSLRSARVFFGSKSSIILVANLVKF